MKTSITVTGVLALMASTLVAANPVTDSRVWTETYPVTTDTPRLFIENIWGNVRVRPGTSGQISVTIDEARSAPDQKRFDFSLEALRLDIEADSDGVSIVVGERSRRRAGYDTCHGCRVDFQSEVLVPVGTQVNVGTVMDGKIDVAGIAGTISASNVNGPVAVADLRDSDVLESVNGAIDLSFARAPDQDCEIETVNGDVTIVMSEGTGLDVAMDLFNGRLVSEFPVETFALPAKIEQTLSDGRNRYRLQQSVGIRLEGGGPRYSISSVNGDIRIQKN